MFEAAPYAPEVRWTTVLRTRLKSGPSNHTG
jgi:hypothetical protein